MVRLQLIRSRRFGVARSDFLKETPQARCLDLVQSKVTGEKRCSWPPSFKQPVDYLVQVRGALHQPAGINLAPILLSNNVSLRIDLFPSVVLERRAFEKTADQRRRKDPCQLLRNPETNTGIELHEKAAYRLVKLGPEVLIFSCQAPLQKTRSLGGTNDIFG